MSDIIELSPEQVAKCDHTFFATSGCSKDDPFTEREWGLILNIEKGTAQWTTEGHTSWPYALETMRDHFENEPLRGLTVYCGSGTNRDPSWGFNIRDLVTGAELRNIIVSAFETYIRQ